MRRLLVLLALAGCGGSSQPEARAPEIAPPKATPKRVHTMQPHELIVQGVPATGVKRGRLAHHGAARFGRDLPSVTSAGWSQASGAIVAIAEVDGDDVRIVHDDDDARLLIWIARGDLATVTTRDVVIREGLELAPGTRIHLEKAGFTAALEGLLFGSLSIDETAVGDMWDAAPPVARDDGDHVLDAMVELREAPDPDALALGIATERITVHLVRDAGDWAEVVTLGPQVRMQGYVPAAKLHDDQVIGTGTGGGYGASHTINVEVPAGACLYDAIGGEMIGINVIARTRMAEKDSDGWYLLLVNSPWALLRVPAHQTDGAFDVCADL